MDNTWATPLYFRALEKGVDLSIQAGTKYIGGHSDIMFGCVSANARDHAGAEDDMIARALRRAGRHVSRRCAACARWRCGSRGTKQSGVARRALAGAAAGSVARAASGAGKRSRPRNLEARLHRRLRDCSASCSSRARRRRCYAFMDALTLFGMGFSWGGFESLVDPVRLQPNTAPRPNGRRAGRRCAFISGWKTSSDLIADLERGFAALRRRRAEPVRRSRASTCPLARAMTK